MKKKQTQICIADKSGQIRQFNFYLIGEEISPFWNQFGMIIAFPVFWSLLEEDKPVITGLINLGFKRRLVILDEIEMFTYF